MGKLLIISFETLGPIMVEEMGSDKITSQAQIEAAYSLAVAHETKNRELSADEASRVTTDTYAAILPAFQRRQALSLVPALHAFDAVSLTEFIKGMPVDQLESFLNAAGAIVDGNPLTEGSPAQEGLLHIAETSDLDYNLDGYAPISIEATAKIAEQIEQGTNPDNTEEMKEEFGGETESAEEILEEKAPEVQEETTSTIAVTKPIITNNLPRVDGIANAKEFYTKGKELVKLGTEMQETGVNTILAFAEKAAAALDTMEAGESHETLELEETASEVAA